MIRKIMLLLAPILFVIPLHAQLYTGSTTGMHIKSGTTVSADSLVLIPDADLTITGTLLTVTDTPVTATGGASILMVQHLSNPLLFQGTVGLYYRDDQLNGNTATNLQLAYRDSLPGSWTTTSGTTVNTTAHYLSYTFAAPAQLSMITATSAGVNLPLNLTRFTATAEANRVRLDWDLFADDIFDIAVQRAADGKHFQTIGTVLADQKQSSYHFFDKAPLAGPNHYRLYWKDEDKEKFAPIRTVVFRPNSDKLSLYPLPAADVLHIAFPVPPEQGSYIQLLSIDGKTLFRKNCREHAMSLDMKSYPAGMYLLSWINGGTASHYRIEKR